MKKILYLIRHGKVDSKIDHKKLTDEGMQFADNLPTLLKNEKIDFIASVKEKNRCKDTVIKLSETNNLKINDYDKIDFLFLKPYHEALKYNTSVICYGVEEISEIFKLFSIEINKENRDSFYHRIIKITIEENYNN
ncbi:histidine phosphatase family protein [Flavobacterium sp.]|uniref:histidine phosphatase family protein n=1 Tax=Flavobacterium sp. TaxID=239 RepID=UPI003BD740A5